MFDLLLLFIAFTLSIIMDFQNITLLNLSCLLYYIYFLLV